MVSGNTVALAAAIGGSVVGLAGVVSNVVLGWLRQGQELELADKQQSHERALARGERLFDRRAPVYESMMRFVVPVMENVEATLPLAWIGPPPDPPAEPTAEDQRAVLVQLRSYGSAEVGDQFEAWGRKVRGFRMRASHLSKRLDWDRETGDEGNEATLEMRHELEVARREASYEAARLERLVSDELAAL